MKILFISSVQVYCSVEKPLYDQHVITLGVSYVSSFLKQAGHDTRMVVLTRDTPRRVLDRAIEDFQPDLVGFTSVYSEYSFIQETAAYVKERYPSLYLIAGGVHVSLNPEEAIQGAFDAICVGEGEHPTLELVEQLERGVSPSDIPNLWIKQGDDIQRNQTRSFVEDLDALPFPDREMWLEWIDSPGKTPYILLGRGCPYNCTYCSNHSLRKLAEGQYVRLRSPENVLEEVKELAALNPRLSHIYFEVETIGARFKYADSLCAVLRDYNQERDKPLSFSVNLRITPNKDYGPFFATLKSANFTSVNIGLESGSPRVREEILKRKYSNEDLSRASRAANANGVKVYFFLLMGLPEETWEDFQETVECLRACEHYSYMLSVFTPYPGTDLYNKCLELGLIEDGVDLRLERRRPVMNLPGFTKRQIRREYLLFAYKVYKGKWSTLAICRRTVGTWIRTSVVLYRCYLLLMRNRMFRDFMRRIDWKWE